MKPQTNVAPNIAGNTDPKCIAEMFANDYCKLYNSVHSDHAVMQHIRSEITQKIQDTPFQTCAVSHTDIEEAIACLKKEKYDGSKGLCSSHLVIGKRTLSRHIARLATAILTHGHQPRSILLATINSVPKNKRGNMCDAANYRGIALSSPVGKVLDKLFLKRNEHLLKKSEIASQILLLPQMEYGRAQ